MKDFRNKQIHSMVKKPENTPQADYHTHEVQIEISGLWQLHPCSLQHNRLEIEERAQAAGQYQRSPASLPHAPHFPNTGLLHCQKVEAAATQI